MCKDGNTKARTTMIELAWLWLQLESPLSAWFRQRVGSLKVGRITIVAKARKLLRCGATWCRPALLSRRSNAEKG
jgi:hypothetical protein